MGARMVRKVTVPILNHPRCQKTHGYCFLKRPIFNYQDSGLLSHHKNPLFWPGSSTAHPLERKRATDAGMDDLNAARECLRAKEEELNARRAQVSHRYPGFRYGGEEYTEVLVYCVTLHAVVIN